jgi:hypothetical protein
MLSGKFRHSDFSFLIRNLGVAIQIISLLHVRLMRFLRLLAWTLISGLVILTIVPASERPVTGVEHHYEHLLAFGFTGLIYALSYPRRLVMLLTQGVVFALALELLQVPLPSRHARFGDFAVDALAGCGGMVVSYLSTKLWDVKSS